MEPEVEGERLGIHSGQRNRRGQTPLLRGGRGPRHRGWLRPHQRVGRGPRLRGVGERGRGQDHRPRHRQQQQRVLNEIRAMVVDYVINHGTTMRAAATMFHPNLRRSSMASIIRTFRNENRIEIRPNRRGRSKILTDQQEQAVVNMVQVRNDIRLRETQQHILDNDDLFSNVNAISLPTTLSSTSTLAVKQRHLQAGGREAGGDRDGIYMEFNRIAGKNLKKEFYESLDRHSTCLLDIFRAKKGVAGQLLMDLLKQTKLSEPTEVRTLVLQGLPLVYGDDSPAFFKTCLMSDDRSSNLDVPVGTVIVEDGTTLQPLNSLHLPLSSFGIVIEGKVVMDNLPISEDGVVGRRPCVGSYNAALIIAFLDELNQVCRADGVTYVIVWDNVQFHHSRMVQAWFQAHPQFLALHLPPYSPFLNPIEEFFSTWRWKVYDRHPHEQVTLLQAMDDACNDITADQCQAWIRHARRFFPRCLANENIHCDVDENLWPNPQDRVDGNIDP
ncbi:Insertion element IS630 uncharacterized 39 kDa protein [Labeo rohita]|uniref:Insertion element IS630 uncharacterized 39 kDa protein n=1 Tax=Labeo rohita TaxID=84645 RepID=A0ABQ8L773_LABRO|nr:Insertion element IS630 uncharacterized 39 kDa protein [Labeo rohita]